MVSYTEFARHDNKCWVARRWAADIDSPSAIVGIADTVEGALLAAKQNGCDDPILSYEVIDNEPTTSSQRKTD